MLIRLSRLVRAAAERAKGEQPESGFAMIVVIGMSMVLSLMLTGLLAISLMGTAVARHRQDYPAALQAAMAGVDDYLTRLNFAPANYWTRTDPSNTALTSWTDVSGAVNGAQFRYSVDSSKTATTGKITISSSGRVNGVVRTVRATLKVSSFADYLYFSDYETLDPKVLQDVTDGQVGAAGAASCGQYYWQNSGRYYTDNYGRRQACPLIYFTSGDTLNGKVHSNDQLAMMGTPKFAGQVESGAPNGVFTSSSASPTFSRAGDPKHTAPIPLPRGNDDVLTSAETPDGGKLGCVFTGPTEIVFKSADPGYMYVTSPDTTSSTAPSCGTWPSTAQQRLALPGNGVLYVKSGGAGRCVSEQQMPGDVNSYNCTYGDAFVSGQLGGQLTVGADDRIIATGDITYNPNMPSVLGLISRNMVEVWHPVKCTTNRGGNTYCTNIPTRNGNPIQNIEIDALIMSNSDSFMVQKYWLGEPLGQLTVKGGIIQRYRGAVGTSGGGGTGYKKDYQYDSRLKTMIPPHFTPPGDIQWTVDTYGEEDPRTTFP